MIAKFKGTCRRCSGVVFPGEQISWSRKHRGVVYHITCPNGSTPTAEETETESTEMIERDAEYTHVESVHERKVRVETEEKPHTNSNGHTSTGNATETLTNALRELIGATPIDDAAVRSIFREETSTLSSDLIGLIATEVSKIQTPAQTITVQNLETNETRDMGVQHKQFPLLLKVLSTRLNVWLAGPSGSGKTQAAMNVASALGLKFYFCGAQSNEYGLSGFTDAQGKTVRTLFREAYEHGGMFLFDEVDASNASALLWLNAALSNGHCAFPDAVVERHADFICVAAANTWGFGATNDYVGRAKMDAAFLKRFVPVAWDYDESLETAIAGNAKWSQRVQTIRQRARDKQIKVIISPRESIYGAKLLAAGVSHSDCETMLLKGGMTDTQWESIR